MKKEWLLTWGIAKKDVLKDGAVHEGMEEFNLFFATMDDLAIFTDKGLKWLDICLNCHEFV